MRRLFLRLVIGSAFCALVQAAPNLLTNGDFSGEKIAPWRLFSINDKPKPEHLIKEGVLKISTPKTGAPADRQLVQSIKLETGKRYRVKFTAKGRLLGKKTIRLVAVRSVNPSKPHYGLYRKIELTTEWQELSYEFTAREIDPDDPPMLKLLIGEVFGHVSLKAFEMTEIK